MRKLKITSSSQKMGTLAFLLTMALSLVGGPALAQSWPSKPITIVVPYAPGGGTDITARLIGKRLGEKLGQPVIVDNKPGANGNDRIGACGQGQRGGVHLAHGQSRAQCHWSDPRTQRGLQPGHRLPARRPARHGAHAVLRQCFILDQDPAAVDRSRQGGAASDQFRLCRQRVSQPPRHCHAQPGGWNQVCFRPLSRLGPGGHGFARQ